MASPQPPASTPSATTTGASNSAPKPRQLPLELRLKIAQQLALPDTLKLRLASKDWAVAGAPYLFPTTFTLRPYQPDMERLRAVCANPDIAKGIKSLFIMAGDADENLLLEALVIERGNYKELRNKSNVTKLFKMIQDMYDPSSRHCDKALLEGLFAQLPLLRSISINSADSPFIDHEELEPVWETMMDRGRPSGGGSPFDIEVSKERYFNVISASRNLPSKLEFLSVPEFPIDCLMHTRREYKELHGVDAEYEEAISKPKVEIIKQAFAQLKHLRIGCVSLKRYNNPPIGRAMASLVQAAKKLQSLDLFWTVDIGKYELLGEFRNSFFSDTFPLLRELRITEMEVNDVLMMNFLKRHASTLKYLHLSDQAVAISADNTWKGFLTFLRDELKLEKVEILGDYDAPLYDDHWENPLSTNAVCEPPKLLEMYVLGECPWPMQGDDPRERRGWKVRFIGGHLHFMTMTREERRDFLDQDWETEGEESDDSDEGGDSDDSDDHSDWTDSDDDADAHTADPNVLGVTHGDDAGGNAAVVFGAATEEDNEDDWEDDTEPMNTN